MVITMMMMVMIVMMMMMMMMMNGLSRDQVGAPLTGRQHWTTNGRKPHSGSMAMMMMMILTMIGMTGIAMI